MANVKCAALFIRERVSEWVEAYIFIILMLCCRAPMLIPIHHTVHMQHGGESDVVCVVYSFIECVCSGLDVKWYSWFSTMVTLIHVQIVHTHAHSHSAGICCCFAAAVKYVLIAVCSILLYMPAQLKHVCKLFAQSYGFCFDRSLCLVCPFCLVFFLQLKNKWILYQW